jgi:L-asparaginase
MHPKTSLPLHVVATGGTFDKTYDPIAGRLTFSDSNVDEALARSRLNIPATLTTVKLLDSLDMKEADRIVVRDACVASSAHHHVVIHGTDTMPETARLLGQSVSTALSGKTIVLTGAMIPYTIENSDALFNLGFACACARLLPPNVYVAMNGEVFTWDNVRKDTVEGRFARIR